MKLGDLLDRAGGQLVGAVTIESAAAPPIVFRPFNPDAGDAPSGGGGGGFDPGALAVRILRPRVTIETAGGPVVVAPAGDPPGFPYLLPVVAGVVLLAAVGAWTIGRAVLR